MRGVTTTSVTIGRGDHEIYGTIIHPDHDGSSNYLPTRDGNTPIANGEASSCVSGNYASLIKNIPIKNSGHGVNESKKK
jgi:hypothetical protein